VANFSATNECQGTANEFTDYSTEAASYLWTFESGQTSTDQNPRIPTLLQVLEMLHLK
jgi:PKD repeat protein